LRPFVYSFELKGATKIEGTDAIRAQINAHFSEVLKQGGIRTSTLATQENFLLMTKEEVANTIEIAFKTRFSGSPKHRYKNLLDTPTRNGGIITINSKPEPYIRFDWRNASPDEDQVIPEGLAENFIDVRNAKQTALSAYEMLRKDANSHYLELVDGCFFMSQDGRVICGEVSCDNMNFKYRGHNASYQAIFNDKSKENIQTKWSLILKLLNEGSRNKI
jgi:phosphoribosylaminoimidazole-succinocarboxamide synthase